MSCIDFNTGVELTDLVSIIESIKDLVSKDEELEEIDITISCDDEHNWAYQTGDNSFSGACYGMPYWAMSSVNVDTDSQYLAEELIDQLEEEIAMSR